MKSKVKRAVGYGQVLSVLSLLSCPWAMAAKDVEAEERMNFLFIIADDLRATGPLYDEPEIFTPRLEELAKTSILYRNTYVQAAACSPARTSFLTGMRPEYTGAMIMSKVPGLESGQLRNFRRIGDLPTLPQYFKENGYRSVGIGKTFHIYPPGGGAPDPVSWTEYLSMPRHVKAFHDPENHKAHQERLQPISVELYDAPEENYVDAGFTDETIKFLKQPHDQPFAMVVGYIKPHLAFVAPKKYGDLYADPDKLIKPLSEERPGPLPPYGIHGSFEIRMFRDAPKGKEPFSEEYKQLLRQGYSACVSMIDNQVGRLIDTLEETGLDKNTIVVFTGDHGFHLGENGFFGKNTNFEQSNRTFMMMRVPGVEGGTVVHAPVELLDIYPTVVKAAGLPVPAHVQGKDLLDPAILTPDTMAVSCWGINSGSAEGTVSLSSRCEQYRYTRWIAPDGSTAAEEFYDLEMEPVEITNRIDEVKYKDVIAQRREHMDAHAAKYYNGSWVKP